MEREQAMSFGAPGEQVSGHDVPAHCAWNGLDDA